MIRNLELFSFIFIVLSLILAFIPLLKKKQINTVDDVSLLMNFISKGTKIVLKRFYNYLWVTAIVFITIIFSINIAIHVPAFRALLIIPALMTSVIMGWIGIQVSLNSIKGILGEAHLSLNTIMTSANQKSRLILTILISILLCDVLFWLIGLEYLISNNLFDIGSKLAANFNINWQSDLTNDATSDKIKNLILATSLSGYVLGSALHAVLARFNFSIFATSFDTASDLIGFSKYDFPEDDLRNPGSVPDLMGDQLKHNYLTITSFHSTSMVLIVGLSILGSFIGLIKPPTQSIDLVIYPLFFTAFGLFVTLGISLIVQAVPFIKTSFWKKACQQYLTALVLILTFLYLFQIGKLPSQLYFSTLYGLVFSCLLYPIVCHFISIRSKAIQFVAKYSKDSLLSTISIGLFLGFFAAFFITLLMCVLIKMGFRISGNKVHVFGDFYHIGIMALSFLVGSLSIFIDSFSKPIIDNAIGISEMLGFKEAKKQQLHTLHAHYNVGMCYFHIATIITVSLTVFLYLVLFLINALTSPKIASLLHANNATQGFNLSLF